MVGIRNGIYGHQNFVVCNYLDMNVGYMSPIFFGIKVEEEEDKNRKTNLVNWEVGLASRFHCTIPKDYFKFYYVVFKG